MDEQSRIPSVGRDYAIKQYLKPLEPYLQDRSITEISLCRPQEIWLRSLKGWQMTLVPELTISYLNALITAIITYNGLSQKCVLYVTLPNGERGTIVRPPAVTEGTISFVIRKHVQMTWTLEELEQQGAFANVRDVSFNKPSPAACKECLDRKDFTRLDAFEVDLLRLKRENRTRAFLEACVLYKRNIIIIGKTGSGKTSFARSLIEKVPIWERIVTIEDVHELILPSHPNCVHMLYGTGTGRVSANECLAACMRLSPDRIFLAEIRGGEAWSWLNSLNTGHPGAISTAHASNAMATFSRIVSLIKESDIGRHLDVNLLRHTIYTTLDVILTYDEKKLVEVFYDPIFLKSKLNL